MTDVEPKNVNKRKGLPGNAPANKKQKVAKNEDNLKQKPGKPHKNQKNNPAQVQNGAKSEQKKKFKPQNKEKKDSVSEDSSSKKVKPFAGTSDIKIKKQKPTTQNSQADTNEGKKKRRAPFSSIREKIKGGDTSVLKTLDEKIRAIESKGELSKSANKKLKSLRRLRRAATGEAAPQPVPKQASAKQNKASKNQAKADKSKPKTIEKPKAGKGKGKPAKVVEEEESEDEDDDESSQFVAGATADSDDNSGEDDSEDAGEEADSEDEAADEADSEDEVADEADSDEEEDDDDQEDDDPEDEDESEEEVAPKIEKKKVTSNKESKSKSSWNIEIDDLKKNDLLAKNQKRYVVFVGNIPYDTNKTELQEHFAKCGAIKHIRVPTEKKSNKPRGFAYVEVEDDGSYQKCLSMHHSFLKGRRINVLYTQGGKKKGDEMKKQIKAKNFKLHAMRKHGQLLGSKKETQKRSFRRKKQRESSKPESSDQ